MQVTNWFPWSTFIQSKYYSSFGWKENCVLFWILHKILALIKFIHSFLISCSLIGWLVNTGSVLEMSDALCVLHLDYTLRFWCVNVCVNVKSIDPFFFFSLGEVVNILHVKWHSKAILFIIFYEHEQMMLFFCCVWIRLTNMHLILFRTHNKSKHLPCIWCLSNALGPAGLWHWTHHNSVHMHQICFISHSLK